MPNPTNKVVTAVSKKEREVKSPPIFMMKFDPIPDDRADVSLLLRKNFPCPPNGNVLPECGLEHVAALLRDAKHSVNGSKTVGFCILVTPDHGDTMRFIYPLAWKPALHALQGILDGDSRQEAEWHTRYAESEEYKMSYVATQVMDEPLMKLMTTYFNDGNYSALFVYFLVFSLASQYVGQVDYCNSIAV